MSSPGRGRTKPPREGLSRPSGKADRCALWPLCGRLQRAAAQIWAIRAYSRRHRKAQGGAKGHACAALTPSGAWRRLMRYLPPPLGLDLIPDECSCVRPTKILHGADARRRGDVDLGEIAADHVDADKEEPTLAQGLSDASTNLAVARGELRFLRNAAAHHIGPQIIRRGHPVHCPGELTIHQEDALIAISHRGQELLHHPLLAESHGK